jgi:hypothetical protein
MFLIKNTLSRCVMLLVTFIVTNVCWSSLAIADDKSANQQIQTLISTIYDKPNLKIETTPIVVVNEYAIADWTQGERGGRALLKRIDGKWAIMACGANGFKDAKNLADAGIPLPQANNLVAKLTAAEKSIDPHRLHLFSLFGTKNDPIKKDHHEHHTH